MNVDVGSFTKTSGPTTGNQDIVITRDLTAAAAGTWAIIFWTAGSDQASGTWDAGIEACVGFTTGATNSYTCSWSQVDAASPVSGGYNAAKCIALISNGVSVQAEADFVSFPDATHMRINWTTNGNTALTNIIVINYMIISGVTGAKVVDWVTPTTAIDKSVTGVGFSPDLVLSTQCLRTTVPEINYMAYFSFGAMNKHGQQWSNAIFSTRGGTTSNTASWQQTDASIISVGGSAAALFQSHFKSMDSDGFTVNFSTSYASAEHIFSLCLKGVSSKIGAFTAPAATGSQVIDTRQGFTPRGALFSGIGCIPKAAPLQDDGRSWSLGASDLTNDRSVALVDISGNSPEAADSVYNSNKSLTSGQSYGGTLDAGSITSVSTSQTTVNWTTKDATAREYLYLLLGDAGVNTFPAKVS